MLVLSRKLGERILIPQFELTFSMVAIDGDTVLARFPPLDLMLSETDPTNSNGTFTSVTSRGQTPETCLGYERGDHYTSPEPEAHDVARSYSLPKFLPSDHWALKVKGKVGGQRIVAQEADASLQPNFSSGKVFLVLGTEGNQPVKAIITLN